MDWIYQMLDMAVVEQVSPSLWQPRLPAPAWFHWSGGPIEALSEEFAFLDYFIPEALRLRQQPSAPSQIQAPPGRIRSDIWTQVNADGEEIAFRAELVFGERTALVIQQVNQEYMEIQTTHQWGRDWALASQRLDHRRENAELMGRRKDEFLASMSHELRTPLNSIVGFATLLGQRKGGELTDRQSGFVTNILTASRHLLSLINELLDIAKVDAGRLDLHAEWFPAEDCVGEVLTVLTPQASGKGIRVETRGAHVNVFADRLRLKQILYNLLSNAIKFSAAGEQVTIEFAETRDRKAAATLTVTDHGPGIPASEQAKIFEPFQSRNGKREEGTGLGLAITRRLVEAHGGVITVESAPQKGARFTVTLPYPADRSTPASHELAPRIAVIEGEPGTGLLIRSILEPEHEVAVYTSWDEARRDFAVEAPLLMFLDSHLADADSREVLHEIRQQESLAKMTVAVLTREAATETDAGTGFDHTISKPLGDGRLIEACVAAAFLKAGHAHPQKVATV